MTFSFTIGSKLGIFSFKEFKKTKNLYDPDEKIVTLGEENDKG